MRYRSPHRKLIFPVGLLSLALLPLLFANFLNQEYFHKKPLGVIEVTYWNPRDTINYPNPLRHVNDKFSKITLTGSHEDRIKLDYAELAIREMLLQSDTTLGFEFIFTDGAKYSSLVELLNLCMQEDVRQYMHHRDRFYIFNRRPKPAARNEEHMHHFTL